MEHVLELIENGRAGYVAAMGMGGVFAALLFMFLFIFSLGKAYRFGKLRNRKKSSPPAGPSQAPGQEKSSGGELAAALAVALAVSGRARRTGASLRTGPATEELSPWRTAGRLAMMRPFVRPR